MPFWLRDAFEFGASCVVWATGLAIAAFLAILVFSLLYWPFGYNACSNRSTEMVLDMHHHFNTGCWLKLGETWVQEDNIVPVERDGKIVYTVKPQIAPIAVKESQ